MAPEPPKSYGSPEPNLPAIDETKPCQLPRLDLDVERKAERDTYAGEATLMNSSGPASPGKKKCMKDRLRGLADKYVSCLQAIDGGTGDLRGYGGTGGPTMVPGPQPFEAVSTSPSSISPSST